MIKQQKTSKNRKEIRILKIRKTQKTYDQVKTLYKPGLGGFLPDRIFLNKTTNK
jgi:hypothetical protein